ncbi:MAG TPA: anti-sigma factor [Egibacteraceae bacterium]|nr:anti-sigma factor [Egibacteraceae bacterium]
MTAEAHTLAGPYAVHALPADERAFFERHIAVCDTCGVEVAELLATAAVLGAASEEPSPPGMRDRVLRTVDVTRQHPPAPGEGSGSAPARRWAPPSMLAGVAAVLVLALMTLSGVTAAMNQRITELEIALADSPLDDDRVLAVLTAGDAQTRPLDTELDASVRFVYSTALDRGLFVASGLEPLDADQVYELWLYHDGTPQPATIFQTDSDGRAMAVVEGAVAGAEFAAVTVEPHGGSPEPTGQVVIHGAV